MNKYVTWMVFLVVLITGCQGVGNRDFEKSSPTIDNCRNLDEGVGYSDFQLIGEKEICLANYGKKSNNFTQCTQEEEPYCMGGVAVNSNRLDICKDEQCFIAAGLVSDENFCENAEYNEGNAWIIDFQKEARDICKFGVAISKKNPEICNTLDEQMKYFCMIDVAKAAKDATICEKMQEGLDYECFFIVAIEKKDKQLCKKTSERQKECEDIIVKERAKSELNPNKCYQLEDYYEAAECVSYIASKKSDITICENLQLGFGSVRQECYEKVAMSGDKISDCEKLLGYPSVNGCYKRILGKSPDPIILCKSLSGLNQFYCVRNMDCENSANKAGCTEFSNKILNNPEVCEYGLIPDEPPQQSDKDSCYADLAIKLKSPTLCLKTSNSNSCMSEYESKAKLKEFSLFEEKISSLNYAPTIDGNILMEEEADISINIYFERQGRLTNFELYVNDNYLNSAITDQNQVNLFLKSTDTKKGINKISIKIKNSVPSGPVYPGFDEYPLTLLANSVLISEGVNSASFKITAD